MNAAGGAKRRPQKQLPSIALIGAGRAGSALAVALHSAGYRITAVHNRSAVRGVELAAQVAAEVATSPAAAAVSADLTIVAVADVAIAGVAAGIVAGGASLKGRGLVHCGAGRGPEELASLREVGARVGVLHPLQTLAGAESAALLRGCVISIEADAALAPILEDLVRHLGALAVALPSGSRSLYHAAAVLAGNAPLALLAAAAELLEEVGMDRPAAEQGLAALLAGAAANARRLGLRAALTGPVSRGDAAAVAGHLEVLREHPSAEALYKMLTAETLRLAGLEGREAIAHLLTEPPPSAAGDVQRRVA